MFPKDKVPLGIRKIDFTGMSTREKIEYFRDFFTEHPEVDGVYLPEIGLDVTRESVLYTIQKYYELTGERIEW